MVVPKLPVTCATLYALVEYGWPEQIGSIDWGYLLVLMNGLLAIVTMIASLIPRKFRL